jgi:hypothetical protein
MGLSARACAAPQAVLTALVATAGVVAVCCALAFLTPLDFTKCARRGPAPRLRRPAPERAHEGLAWGPNPKSNPMGSAHHGTLRRAAAPPAAPAWVLAALVVACGAAPARRPARARRAGCAAS